ncbi:TIGR02206 family membrane protein [Mycolicibacterium sp. jd]|nr:TIGR02206 family membrane protein [Mycolicibacterium austroafricanum]
MISAAGEFMAYGPSHWSVIAVFAVGAMLLIWLGRRQTETGARRFGRIGGALTALIYLGASVNALIPPGIDWSVPLHLTDLATLVAAYALWSQRQWAFALTYYWGLVLSLQALISPVLTGPDFPHYQFLGFWAIHLLVVWAAIYLTWGRRMRPTWRSYRLALTVTAVWATITIAFNSIAGTNYGFLNRKPANASLLDLMGPWPVYLLVGFTLVAAVWALMTWPWSLVRRPM